jgi:ubiquinone/menaquinone biosynthesis C-methylase UbiE
MADEQGYHMGDTLYLETAARFLREEKQLTYTAMHIQPGQRVLDVGCGPGVDTIALAVLVGESGSVDGVDADPTLVAAAERRAAAAGIHDRVHHHVADALALPFDAQTFDAVRGERLFQHLSDPPAALAEMLRVARPSGWIVVLDTDYSTTTVDSDQTDLERRLALAAAQSVRSGYVARKLYRMFTDQGLSDISVTVRPVTLTKYEFARGALLDLIEPGALASGIVTEEQLDAWHAELEQADARNAFFACFNMILVSGCKP